MCMCVCMCVYVCVHVCGGRGTGPIGTPSTTVYVTRYVFVCTYPYRLRLRQFGVHFFIHVTFALRVHLTLASKSPPTSLSQSRLLHRPFYFITSLVASLCASLSRSRLRSRHFRDHVSDHVPFRVHVSIHVHSRVHVSAHIMFALLLQWRLCARPFRVHVPFHDPFASMSPLTFHSRSCSFLRHFCVDLFIHVFFAARPFLRSLLLSSHFRLHVSLQRPSYFRVHVSDHVSMHIPFSILVSVHVMFALTSPLTPCSRSRSFL